MTCSYWKFLEGDLRGTCSPCRPPNTCRSSFVTSKRRCLWAPLFHYPIIWDGEIALVRWVLEAFFSYSNQPTPSWGGRFVYITFIYIAHPATASTGYPPPDNAVRNFLTDKTYSSQEDVDAQMRCFLLALLKKAQAVVKNDISSNQTERISNFREYMSRDQSMNRPGSARLSFYEDVVYEATKARCRFLVISSFVTRLLSRISNAPLLRTWSWVTQSGRFH